MAAWTSEAWDVEVDPLIGDLAASQAVELLPHEAGMELSDCLLHLRTIGKLSARDVCVLSHYASLAGAQGPVTISLDTCTAHKAWARASQANIICICQALTMSMLRGLA